MAKKSAKGDAPKEAKAPKADKGKDEAAAKKPRKRKAEAGACALQAPRPVLALHSALPCPLRCIEIHIYIYLSLSLFKPLGWALRADYMLLICWLACATGPRCPVCIPYEQFPGLSPRVLRVCILRTMLLHTIGNRFA